MSTELDIAGFLPKKADTTPEQRAKGLDRWGYTMEERVAWQRKHLDLLRPVLNPKVHAILSAYCERTNKPADPAQPWPGGNHTCPCGYELFSWLLKHGEILSEME